jgi:integrase
MPKDRLRAGISAACLGPAGSLFYTRYGTPYRHDYYGSKFLKEAVERAGLPQDITSHDLRHHFVSVVLAGGAQDKEVAKDLGHTNAALVPRGLWPPHARP